AGYQHVLDTYEAHWNRVVRPHSGDELRSRLLVDPFAIHSETNIRNCDRLCAHLGLDRNLIATTFGDPDHPPPPPPTAWTNDHGYGQGDYFSQGSGPGFVLRLRYFFQMFYMPGSFDQLPTNLAADHSSCAQGTGIFGDGLNDYRSDSALQWIGFTPMDPSPLPVNVRTWKTGVILHYKLHTFFLLHDNRRG
ncbi:MAG TPA: hypothetical protein VHT91_29470, partial [Kofleriaceae bacterium]|nr:hypothetical protein [Kofleriaceae bacterium]